MSISQEIESKVNIVELVQRYVPLKKAGANYKGLSPFVQEKTPSFMVSPTKNIAYCFSSQRGGGPIKFLAEIEKIEYREAMQILAKEVGVELKTDFYKERGSNQTDIYEAYKIAANWYHEELYKTENSEKLAYVKRRGLTEETLKTFQIGYSGDPRGLWALLKSRGMSEKDILESGIFVSPNRDKFFGRIVFPIANFTGHTVGFTGRIIDQWEPKYLNSPASRIFNKSEILYGLHLAKSSIVKLGYVIVVEGQMDTVKLHQAGFSHTVGISGTALTKEHIHLLRRLTSKIFLCLDADKAGVNATFSSLESLLNEEVDCKIIQVDGGKDPDEFIESGGNFTTLIEAAITPVQFFINAGKGRYDFDSAVGKTQVLREALKYVRKMTNRIEVDMSIKYLARSLDISENVVYEELKWIRLPVKKSEESTKAGLDFWQTIVGYCRAYGFYDLFLASIDYTSPHFEGLPSFDLIRSEILAHLGQSEPADVDALKALELMIESENEWTQRDTILLKFSELVKRAQKLMFEHEKQALASSMDQNSIEYMQAHLSLISKGKKLGII